MIHVTAELAGKNASGLNTKMRIVGLQREDLETLAKDGILQFDLPNAKVALMFVKGTKEEFLAELNKLAGLAGGNPTSV